MIWDSRYNQRNRFVNPLKLTGKLLLQSRSLLMKITNLSNGGPLVPNQSENGKFNLISVN